MANPLVSVIIPTFNRAYCLGRAIDSVRTQTHQDTEILVLDDGSTDSTRALIEQSYADDRRVRYSFHENRGVSATRNRGLSLARGDYVALLDSDDTWSSWKLELQLACMERCSDIGMVWSEIEAIGPDGDVISPTYLRTMYSAYQWFPRKEQLFPQSFPLRQIAPALTSVVGDRALYTGEIFSQMIMGNLVHTSTVLMRRERLEKIRGFNEKFRYAGEDYDFHLRTCRQGPVGFVDLATIRYQTGSSDQLTSDAYKLDIATNCMKTVLPWIEEKRSEIQLPDQMIQQRLAEIHTWVGDLLLNAGDAPKARLHLRKSLGYQRWQPAAWKALALACLPESVRGGLRTAVRELKLRVRARKGKPLFATRTG
jgi:GT2 family glycosyltransferase